ncbi:MAG: GGDEF domain-containing protein [Candidatus Omnitrophota bacterium]
MLSKLVQKTKFLIAALAFVIACIAGFNFLILQQESILRKYFIETPQEELKEAHLSLANSLSKYFDRENKYSTLEQVTDYIKRYGKTALFELFFIFQDKDSSMKQISKIGITTVSNAVLSSGNVYPAAIDSGNIEGYLMVMIKGSDSTELAEGMLKYKIISYSLRLIFLLLVTALLMILFYHDYSAKMRLARDMAEIKASNDGLTELHTHEHFMKALDIEVEKVNIYDTPLALLMLDIDHFKNFNDTYGHMAGDAVLQEVSKIIRISTRASDILARYGGEEFSVIVPYVAKPGDIAGRRRIADFLREIKNVAERIRRNVEENTVEFNSNSLKVTISIGVAFYYKKAHGLATADLIQKADSALYQAKRHGRNRVCINRGLVTDERDDYKKNDQDKKANA